jgi:hypothetical protein
MTFLIHRLGKSIEISAEVDGLVLRGPGNLSNREQWPEDALAATGGWRTAIEIEQLTELGFAEERQGNVLVPFQNFQTIDQEMPVSFTTSWSQHSPFLLKIDRKSDLGRSDFQYRYAFLLAGRQIPLERIGYYVRRPASSEIFLLDSQMYSLIEAMDAFNALSPEAKTPQKSWLTFAKVKGCATEVGATLDSTLSNNDVIVPSLLGLDMKEDEDGALSFLPKCAELADAEFHQVFERNPGVEKCYSLDRPGLGRVRIVLTDQQHEVLRRMKRVRRIKGDLKDSLKRDPGQVFDGVAEDIDLPDGDLPYGDRVIGIGEFAFKPIPRANSQESGMGELWQAASAFPAASQGELPNPELASEGKNENVAPSVPAGGGDEASNTSGPHSLNASDSRLDDREKPEPDSSRKKYLLIDSNDEAVNSRFVTEAEKARRPAGVFEFERPDALRHDRSLRPHQEDGVRWLQTCAQTPGRKGVLLADDMGVGKTIQVLTFLAWCIESGKFTELSKPEPPFRPILIVAPLILLDTHTWEQEMEKFFDRDGVVFWPVLVLHGAQLAQIRHIDAEGAEVEIGKPILDLDKIQRNRVVITNYETLKNYQHSFAYNRNGKSLWSLIVTDEAQEFKIPNTKLSHAMKALKADLQIACTGTPVENRLLDLWNLCDVLQPGLLASAREFSETFEKNRAAGAQDKHLHDLKKKLLFQQPHAFLLRRTKREVASLPEKRVIPLDCTMSPGEIAAHQTLLGELQGESKPTRFLAVLQRFAQLYQHPALLTDDAEGRSVEDLIRQSSKLRKVLETLRLIRGKREKAIIFARHRAMQGILAKVLQSEFQMPVRIINGDTKMRARPFNAQGVKTRNAILNDFKSRPGFNVVILSPFVAGIGLTIVEANHVVHYGRWWNPAVETQATDRAYRIGQTKEVSVYLPILRDPTGRVSPSFDERLDVLMVKKQRLAEDFLRPLEPEEELGAELFTNLREEAKLRS